MLPNRMSTLEDTPYDRFSQNQALDSVQVYKGLLSVSWMCFGNQNSQLDTFNRKFVKEYRWVTESQFKQIVNICWWLPGPTILQFLITMVSMRLQSISAGFLAFLVLNIPQWICFSILGALSDSYLPLLMEHTQGRLILLGINVAAAGIIFRTCIQCFLITKGNPGKLLIILTTTAIIFIFRSVNAISFCLCAGSIVSLYLQTEVQKKLSIKSESMLSSFASKYPLSKVSVLLIVGLYILMGIWFGVYYQSPYVYTYVFYFVGCFMIGPANTIFLYFYINFLEMGIISEQQLLLGAPLAFLFPGSVANIGIYYGAIIDGFRGVAVSLLLLYLPCMLSLVGVLPEWKYYRNKSGIQRLNAGITLTAAGFCLGYILIVMEKSIAVDESLSIILFLLSAILNYVEAVYSCFVILLCGFLANCRRWGLIYYRFMDDKPYY